MKPMTAEWVEKAEGDFAMLMRESRARKNPSYDGACFHAQQCAEKYLKARLCEAGIEFAKIHDLVALLDQTLAVELAWEQFRKDLAYLFSPILPWRSAIPASRPTRQRPATPANAVGNSASRRARHLDWIPCDDDSDRTGCGR
jgi:hypothetical protein